MVTVITLDGIVLRQNELSWDYWGNITDLHPAAAHTNALAELFSCEPTKYAHMMEDVRKGHVWKGKVEMCDTEHDWDGPTLLPGDSQQTSL